MFLFFYTPEPTEYFLKYPTAVTKKIKCDDPITVLVNNRIERSIITSLKAVKIERGLEV